MIRSLLVFSFLGTLKLASQCFFRAEMRWVGAPQPRAWRHLRLVAFLNHTSLFEPIFLAGVPWAFVWRLARHGVVPAAAKTTSRPLVGWVFKLVARHVVPITRERDHTWTRVLEQIDPDSMVVMAPEGRMKRANGLDSQGQPMTVRGGIADILEAIPNGDMLVAYSGGLHHVQVPGQRLPRVFQRIGLMLEIVDIAVYRTAMATAGSDFKTAVKRDLERRRNLYCPQVAVPAIQ
jgi:Acyltransferase